MKSNKSSGYNRPTLPSTGVISNMPASGAVSSIVLPGKNFILLMWFAIPIIMKLLKLLQVSDICNSSCFNALEFDQYGYYDERYLLGLSNKIYRRKGNLFSYGLKFLPGNLHQSAELLQNYPWLKKI
jgi:hypothetical protein